MFVRIMTAIIFLAFIITLCPYAYSQRTRSCGKEYRIKTRDGNMLQGKLLSNDGNMLALRQGASGLHTISLANVASAHRVKRRTLEGFLIGSIFGTGVGLTVAFAVDKNWESQGWDWDKQIWTFVLITAGSGIIGGVVGGILGHNTQALGPVQLEALPLCFSPSGDMIPVKVNFAINF